MIQARLWNDCNNNCKFCSLIGRKVFTSKQNKILRIIQIPDIVNKYNKVGLIGGEFFEGQLYGIEEEWLNMIKNIRSNVLYITANLIYKPYLLDETLKLRPDILICTSYDTIGRFKNEQDKLNWLNRVNSLDNVFCTIIPTQDMINDEFIDQIKCPINLCEPHLGLQWLIDVDKQMYHQHLVNENKIFNLPKRQDLLKWIIQRPKILAMLKQYKYTHFSNIIGFNQNNEVIFESKDRFNDNNFMNVCGHPYFSQCYSDSDKCLLCDVEEC